MRALILLALMALVAAPVAAAAAFELPDGRVVERPLDPGHEAVFDVRLVGTQDGFLYAKLLVTEGNAANDGQPNGSLATGAGWSVAFALVRQDGSRTELGEYLDSTSTPLAPVAAREALTLQTTVRVPEDAARGGPSQRVYIAIAYRLNPASGPGGQGSGASMDEARAVTLILSNALLPPVETGEDPAAGEVPPTPATGGLPTTPAAPPVTRVGGEAGGMQTIVVREAFPSWFLAGVLALMGLMLAVLALGLLVLMMIWRDMRPRAPPPAATLPAAAPDPHESPDAFRSVPVEAPATQSTSTRHPRRPRG